MPTEKPTKKPASKKSAKTSPKKPDKVAAVNARIDRIVATLNKALNTDVEAGA